MKRMKKLFAILMTMAMVMGLGVTGFADTKDSATITITNAENATLSMVQVIKADPKTETGWSFVGNAGAAYTEAFEVTDAQDAIWMLIGYADKKAELPDGVNAATAEQINKALNKVSGFKSFTNGSSVTEAGIYVINAVEKDYTYNKMAAYVGFGEIKDGEGNIINEYPSLIDAEIEAKKSPISITKEVNDTDGYYAIGQILTYTLETYVPYVEPDEVNNFIFNVEDELYNARYYLSGENSIAKVELEGAKEPIKGKDDFVIKQPEGKEFFTEGFTIDLSDLVNSSNSNAGKKVTITYTVKVTGEFGREDFWNNAVTHVGNETEYADQVRLHTGNIVLTKYNEKKTEKLAGAGFEVRKKKDDGTYSEPLKFIQVAEGMYIYAPEATSGDGAVTEIFTSSKDNQGVGLEKGVLVITGVDAGEYQFTETTAPKGYSLNSEPVSATLDQNSYMNEGTRGISRLYIEYISMKDTKLSALPSTGGMGTTLFTIAGCVIMISAAGLFFATRKKAN